MSGQEQEKPKPIVKKRKEEGKGIKQENKIKQIKLDALMLQQIIRKNPT